MIVGVDELMVKFDWINGEFIGIKVGIWLVAVNAVLAVVGVVGDIVICGSCCCCWLASWVLGVGELFGL